MDNAIQCGFNWWFYQHHLIRFVQITVVFHFFFLVIEHKLILTFDVVQLIYFFYGILENLLFNRYRWNCSDRLNLTSKCRVWFIKVQIQLTTQKWANNWWEWTNKCQWYIWVRVTWTSYHKPIYFMPIPLWLNFNLWLCMYSIRLWSV